MAGDEPVARARITASYEEAVRALGDLGPEILRWDLETPCGEWTLLELWGHLLAIARYWHRLLDAALAGHHAVGLPRGPELAAMNARDLRELRETEGPRRVQRFLHEAAAHLERIEASDWNVTLGEWAGFGPLTVGEHSGVAIGEWHVHAWDVARALGADHRPSDADAVAQGNRVLREVPRRGDQWHALLAAYERDPGWVPTASRSAPEPRR